MSATSESGRGKRIVLLLIGAVLFGIAHSQAPLYFSNQHQYFLHGAAAGGEGLLNHDWLANTRDPTPVFSKFVAVTYRHLHPWVFYAVHFSLMMIYFISLMMLADWLIPAKPSRSIQLFTLGCLLIVVHAGIFRWASVRWFGIDYPFYFQAGVAGQYVLGPGLQPSAFGVLLMASIAAFVRDRLVWAVVFLAAGCWMHATYLLPGALLTVAYLLSLFRERRTRAAIFLASSALLAVLPIVVDAWLKFSPTTPEMFHQSQELLATFRIPHHALVSRWLDPIAIGQLTWIALAIVLLRRNKLGWVMAIAFLMAAGLAVAQVATENLSFALMFPWRLSVILVPIATTAIPLFVFAYLPNRRWIWWACGILMASVVAGSIVVQVKGWGYYSDDRELPALEFVLKQKRAGNVYLIPVRVPGVASGPRGVVCQTFVLPAQAADKQTIPVDLQRFRLFTGAPLYIDYKSIPYKDAEVLEWRRRLQKNQDWYKQIETNSPAVLQEMKDAGITHLVIQADHKIPTDELIKIYEDDVYRIYQLKSAD